MFLTVMYYSIRDFLLTIPFIFIWYSIDSPGRTKVNP